MDKFSQLSLRINFETLKEPNGFLKIIEIVLAIFAFATTTAPISSSALFVECPNQSLSAIYPVTIGYAYSLSSIIFPLHDCNGTAMFGSLIGDYSSASQFYVFVGVITFLYSLAALVFYLGFIHKIRQFPVLTIVDFVVGIVITIIWLIGSSVWADGLNNVKYYSNFDNWDSQANVLACESSVVNCKSAFNANYASLNVSIIFGFLNMCVWGGNLWFLFKETSWFAICFPQPDAQHQTTTIPPATLPTSFPAGEQPRI